MVREFRIANKVCASPCDVVSESICYTERLKFLLTVYQGTASAVPFRGQLIPGFSR
jgi:hypothetical protein